MHDFDSLVSWFDRFRPEASVALWFSGGSDSRLLLEAMVQAGVRFSVLRFEDGWTAAQKKQVDDVLIGHRLQAFSYPALRHTMIRENGELALVSEYAISGGRPMPIIRDLVDDPGRCAFEIQLDRPEHPYAPATWAVNIVGLRATDQHWAFGTLSAFPTWEAGKSTFHAPLFEWGREEVTEALRGRGIDLTGQEDTGDIRACTGCLKEDIGCPRASVRMWNPENNLISLRSRYGGVERTL